MASKPIITMTLIGFLAGIIFMFFVQGPLSSSLFLTKKNTYVLYFGESIDGLEIGTPVNMRGIQIGVVSDIKVQYDEGTQEFSFPVYIQIIPGRLTGLTGQQDDISSDLINSMVKRGLRATAMRESLISSKFKIEFDFHPYTPIRLTGLSKDYAELPTEYSSTSLLSQSLTQSVKRIGDLPIEDLFAQIQMSINAIHRILQSVESADIGEALYKQITNHTDLNKKILETLASIHTILKQREYSNNCIDF